MKTTPVLLVNDLAGFVAEVPPGKVRLNMTEKLSFTGRYHIPQKDIFLNLQGVNPEGEIVWLVDNWTVSVRPGGPGEPPWIPWTPREQSLYDNFREAHRLVHEHLTALGYDVRDGQYALPKTIQPVTGIFECLHWHKQDDDTYRVELRSSPPATCVCGHAQSEHEANYGPCHVQGCDCPDFQAALPPAGEVPSLPGEGAGGG